MCAFPTSFLGYCSFCLSWILGGGFLSVFFISFVELGWMEGRRIKWVGLLINFLGFQAQIHTHTLNVVRVSEWVSEREFDYLILGVLGGETAEASLRVLVAVLVHLFLKCFSSEWIYHTEIFAAVGVKSGLLKAFDSLLKRSLLNSSRQRGKREFICMFWLWSVRR